MICHFDLNRVGVTETHKEEEHNLQCACVRWFNLQWPEYRGLLFAVPNGGARSKTTAGKLKAEGVVAGVADLILLVPQWFTTWRGQKGCLYGGLCQECLAKGILTPATQVHHRISPFQRGLSQQDFDYYAWDMSNLEAICRDCHAAIHAKEGQTV